MEVIEKAKLAGFFQGDGHIGICMMRRLNIHGCYHSFLQVTMTNNERLLLEPYLFFGGRIIQCNSFRVAYRWYLYGSSAVNFLQNLLPYLGGNKAKQASLAFEYQKIKSRKKHRLTKDEALRLDQLGHEINSLSLRKQAREKREKQLDERKN